MSRYCERCGREITGEPVGLELNGCTGLYSDPEIVTVPPEQSQGLFYFGANCAKTIQANDGRSVHNRSEGAPLTRTVGGGNMKLSKEQQALIADTLHFASRIYADLKPGSPFGAKPGTIAAAQYQHDMSLTLNELADTIRAAPCIEIHNR